MLYVYDHGYGFKDVVKPLCDIPEGCTSDALIPVKEILTGEYNWAQYGQLIAVSYNIPVVQRTANQLKDRIQEDLNNLKLLLADNTNGN